MNATMALIRDTFREAFARRIFWGFFACCTLLLLFLIFIMRIDVVQGALATVSIFGNSMASTSPEKLVQQTQSVIAMVLYFAGMALSVFASAGLVAAVFEPGRIELLLSKPVSRTHLLLGRYAGNVLVVSANILYLVVGTWIIFGIKTGVWGAGFLVSSLFTIFIFSVLLSVIVLIGALWDSSAVAIMVTFGDHADHADSGAEIDDRKAAEFGVVARCGARSLLRAAEDVRCCGDYPEADSEPADYNLDAGVEYGSVRDRGAGSRVAAVSQQEFLMRRCCVLFVLSAAACCAQPQIDAVLVKMVPPGTTSLAGAHMDRIKTTDFYKKLVEQHKLPSVDQFAAETGFDPRRDVRELLFANTVTGGVLVARGTFRLNEASLVKGAKRMKHGEYNIWTGTNGAFCVLDATLVAAGDLSSVEAALDEWKSGKHNAAQSLLARAKDVDPGSQFWGVSSGFAGFLADHMPRAASGVDFSRVFRGLEDTWFDADFSKGLRGQVHGVAATDQDAINLRDAAKGLIGFGRLSVPENQPEMLKLWDGITVDQQGRTVAIRADIPQSMVDQMVRMLSSAAGRGGRGGTAPR